MDTSESYKNEPDVIAFNIEMEETTICPKSGRLPARFAEYQQKSQVNKMRSTEGIFQKQIKAAERRQAYENAKIERIKERTEECRKIDQKVNRLGVNTNYYGGYSTDNVKQMSSKETVKSVKSLAKDFSKITTGIKSDAVFAKRLNDKS